MDVLFIHYCGALEHKNQRYAHQELVKARDVHVKNNPSLGDSAVNNREAARFVSASTPFAGKALDVRVDGTYATALSSDALLQSALLEWPATSSGRPRAKDSEIHRRILFLSPGKGPPSFYYLW